MKKRMIFLKEGVKEKAESKMKRKYSKFQMDGSSKRCSYNDRTTCRNNPCRFMHSEFLCRTYSITGKCDQGIQCPGRHPTGVCKRWKHGNCHLKTEVCQFRHHEDNFDENSDREVKRKRSFESYNNGRAKSSRVDSVHENSRNDFLCEQLTNLIRKNGCIREEGKGKWLERRRGMELCQKTTMPLQFHRFQLT